MYPDNLGRTIQGASSIDICGGDLGVLSGVSEGHRVNKRLGLKRDYVVGKNQYWGLWEQRVRG